MREDPLTKPASLSPDREAPRGDERTGTAKKGRGTNGAKRAKQRRHTAAH